MECTSTIPDGRLFMTAATVVLMVTAVPDMRMMVAMATTKTSVYTFMVMVFIPMAGYFAIVMFSMAMLMAFIVISGFSRGCHKDSSNCGTSDHDSFQRSHGVNSFHIDGVVIFGV